MKTKSFIFSALFVLPLLFCACQKLDTPPLDSSNKINGFKCFVYYNAANWDDKLELNVMDGKVDQEKGTVVYTFPTDPKITKESVSRCRLELSIPPTATVKEIDASDNEISAGIGGIRNLYKTTVYFKVVAANGEEKKYQVQFKFN